MKSQLVNWRRHLSTDIASKQAALILPGEVVRRPKNHAHDPIADIQAHCLLLAVAAVVVLVMVVMMIVVVVTVAVVVVVEVDGSGHRSSNSSTRAKHHVANLLF